MANGQVLHTDKMVSKMEWWCRGHTLCTDMQVLDLSAYDAILGYDWLRENSPMTCHWGDHTVEFLHKGTNIKLQGVHTPPLELSTLSADSFLKWHQGNESWALAVVNFVDSQPVVPLPEIEALLTEFEDVFAKPSQLPPPRVYVHTIPLLPNTIPVNSKPYTYSPMHKTEIERQVQELLAVVLITQITSPFASPVLLI